MSYSDSEEYVLPKDYLIARCRVGRQTLLWPRLKVTHFSWLGPELLEFLLGPLGFNWCFFLFIQCFQAAVQNIVSLSPRF